MRDARKTGRPAHIRTHHCHYHRYVTTKSHMLRLEATQTLILRTIPFQISCVVLIPGLIEQVVDKKRQTASSDIPLQFLDKPRVLIVFPELGLKSGRGYCTGQDSLMALLHFVLNLVLASPKTHQRALSSTMYPYR